MKKIKLVTFIMAGLVIFNIAGTGVAGEKVILTATASSYQGSNTPDKAVDSNLSSFWAGKNNLAPWDIKLDAGELIRPKIITINWHENKYALDYDIKTSSDGQSWNNAYTGLGGSGGLQTYELQNEARYVKLVINTAKGNFPKIYEIGIDKYRYIPRMIRFQGKLMENGTGSFGGSSENLTVTFNIYDTETGGVPLWNEVHQNIEVEGGILDVVLGSQNGSGIDLPFDKQYYLGIEVEDDGEMSPRFLMTSVPYAYSSER